MFVDPYRTVMINVIAACLLFLGLLIYKYKNPKKEIDLFKILVLISLLPLVSLLRPGDYESGDFNIHIYRIMSFYDSLTEGNIMPSWAGELNATYGNPLFIFNYSFPYYAISFFHLLGLSFIASMKLYLGITLFSSGIFMYFFVKELTGNKLAAFASAVFYIFNPYHLIDVHFRATLGESTIFSLAPLAFFLLIKYQNTKKINFLILAGLFTGILFQGHPLMALTILGIMSLFTIYQNWIKKRKKKIILIFSVLIFGALSSLYLWASFIIFAPFMYPYPSTDLYFYPFNQLFYSPWKFGFLFQGHFGELALIIGYTQLIVVVASAIALLRNKVSKNLRIHFIFWLSLFLIFLFLMHPFSFAVWKFFPIFWMFIPTGRLLLPIALITSVLAGYFTLNFSNNKKLIYLLLTAAILTTILNWGHRTVLPQVTDKVLRTRVWSSTIAEGRVAYFLNNRWAEHDNFWFSEKPSKPLEVLEGKGKVIQVFRNSTRHTYIIDANSPLTIKENTLYYPGWTMKSNNKKVEIYPGKRGVINAKLPPGLQKVELTYEDIFIYKISKIFGAGVILIFIFYLIFLPIQNISPGIRKYQIGFRKKNG